MDGLMLKHDLSYYCSDRENSAHVPSFRLEIQIVFSFDMTYSIDSFIKDIVFELWELFIDIEKSASCHFSLNVEVTCKSNF